MPVSDHTQIGIGKFSSNGFHYDLCSANLGKGPSFVLVKDTDTERHREENDGQSHHPSSCVLGSSAASASAGPTFHDGW